MSLSNMKRAFDAIVTLPCTAVGIRVADGALTEICFLRTGTRPLAATDPLAQLAERAISGYLADPKAAIDLPLAVVGTDFQQRVWQAITRIPVGATRTYGELAMELGGTARAVGQACGDNRLPLAIPCHRVVASDGLGGFAHRSGGSMLAVKQWLLAHESLPAFTLQ
jgi:methylated-DNA-[protein]-cysteine S-methyltransferase